MVTLLLKRHGPAPAASGDTAAAAGEPVVVLSMDAYHYTNDELRKRELAAFKGRHDTIDADAFGRDIVRLSTPLRYPIDIKLPYYDRELHNPVADKIVVTNSTQVVIVEGLYVLGTGVVPSAWEQPWDAFRSYFSSTLFLDVPEALSKVRVVQRKVDGGREKTAAEAYYEAVDAPILRSLHRVSCRADVSITCTGSATDTFTVRTLLSKDIIQDIRKLQEDSEAAQPLLMLGLNPALQRTLIFKNGWTRSKADEVCRVSESLEWFGGKVRLDCF